MKLLSVNVSLPKEVPHGRNAVSTGIFKEPVEGRVVLRTTTSTGMDRRTSRTTGASTGRLTCTPSRTTTTGDTS
jgi:hypothetical protein